MACHHEVGRVSAFPFSLPFHLSRPDCENEMKREGKEKQRSAIQESDAESALRCAADDWHFMVLYSPAVTVGTVIWRVDHEVYKTKFL